MARDDKMTKDIRQQLKGMAVHGGKYFKGTAKLFLASGTELINMEMPTMAGMIDTNRELLEDTARFLRNPVDSINKSIDRAMGSENYKALAKFAKNALSDLKSGDLYVKDRDRSEFGEGIDSLLDNFGDFDMTGFGEDGEYTEPADAEGFDRSVKLAAAQDRNADDRTNATIGAIGASTSAIVNTSNANAQTNIRMSLKQHSQMMNAMQNMVTHQGATLQAVNTMATSMLEVGREAHQQTMAQLQGITDLLTQIRDNTTPAKPEKFEVPRDEEIFDVHGGLNIRAWLKQVRRNADDNYGISNAISMMTGGVGLKTLLEAAGDNPLQLITDQVLQKMLPEYLKQTMEVTGKYMENFFPALLGKFAERGRNFSKLPEEGGGKISDFIMGLLGVNVKSRTGIDVSSRDPSGQASLTNRTVQAIEQVIPMWLSKIYSAISGEQLQMYDYRNGKLMNAAEVFSKTTHDANDLAGRMGTAGSNFRRRAETSGRFARAEQDKDFQEYLYQWMQHQAENGTFINPFMETKDFLEYMPETSSTGNKEMYGKLIQAVLQKMPRHELMALSSEINSARTSRNRANATINNELRENGLGVIFGGMLDPALQSKLESQTKRSRYGLSVDERDKAVTDAKAETLKAGGFQATNILMTDILTTLQRGIVTYTYIIGKGNAESIAANNPALREALKTRDETQSRMDTRTQAIHDRQTREDEQKERDRKKREAEQRELDRGLSNLIINADTDFETMLSSQEAINLRDLPAGTSDDPRTEATRRLLTQGKDKLKEWGIDPDKKFFENLSRFMTRAPFKLLDDGMKTVDAFLFKIIYGEDAMNAAYNTDKIPSLMRTVEANVKAHWQNAKDWFSEHIGKPLRDSLFDKEKGLIPRIASKLIDPAKEKAKAVGSRIRDKLLGTDEMVQAKNEDGSLKYDDKGNPIMVKSGHRVGGKFSAQYNRIADNARDAKGKAKGMGRSLIDTILYGDYADTKGVHTDLVYEDGKFIGHNSYGGLIGKSKRAIENLNGLLFGMDPEDTSRAKFDMVKGEIKQAFPNMTIGAGLGLVGSLFLPGGPLLGMILGAGSGLVTGSEGLKKFLFGNEIESDEIVIDKKTGRPLLDTNGNLVRKKTRSGGLIDTEIYEAYKKYIPAAGKGAALGVLGSMFLPGGPLIGGIIGSFGGILSASDQFKELLFGKPGKDKDGLISKEFRDKVKSTLKDKLPTTFGGAALGAGAWSLISSFGIIPGLSLLPGGPIFGFIGGLMGATQSDKIKEFFFGEETEEDVLDDQQKPTGEKRTVRKGGLFGRAFDFTKQHIMEPAAKKFNEYSHNIGNWFQDNVLKPFEISIRPLKENIAKAGEDVKKSLNTISDKILESFNNIFERNVGQPMGEFFKEKILTPLENITNKIFSTIGKVIGNIISAPFKALEFIVNGTVGGKTVDEMSDERRAKRKEEREARKEARTAERAKRVQETRESLNQAVGGIKGFFGKFFGPKGEPMPESDSEARQENRGFFSNLFGGFRAGWNRAKGGRQSGDTGSQQPSAATATDSKTDKHGRESSDSNNSASNKQEEQSKLKEAKRKEKEEVREKEKASREKEEADREKKAKAAKDTPILGKNKRKKKSDNEYLEDIAKHTKQIPNIFSEIKGQLGGSGWNLAYIKTLLDKHFGKLDDEELPEEMEGSKKVKKHRGFFGRMYDRVTEAVSGVFSGIKDRVASIVDTVFHPFRLVGKALNTLKEGALGVGRALKGAVQLIGEAAGELVRGLAEGVGNILAGIGVAIKAMSEGIGKALGDTLGTLTGVLKDGVLATSSIVRGLVETAANIAPDIAQMAWNGMKFVGKGIGKGIKFAASGVAGGVKWLFNKITGKDDDGEGKSKTKIKKLGKFVIDGGYLDEIKGLTPIAVGGETARIPFPVLSVIRGMARKKSNYAIPVYILGIDKDAKFSEPEEDEPETPGDENPTNTPALPTPGDKPAEPAPMNEDQSEQQNAASGVAGGVKRPGFFEPVKDAARKAAEKFRRWKRKYLSVDKAAEASPNPAEEYDRAIGSAQSQEEADAVLAAQQSNANGALIPVGGGGEQESGGSGILDFLMGKGGMLAKIAAVALPALFHFTADSGEPLWGAELIGSNLLRGLGINKLSPAQIVEAIKDPEAAKRISAEMVQEGSEAVTKSGTKAYMKNARTARNLGRVGKVGRWIGDKVSSGVEWLKGTKLGQMAGNAFDTIKTKAGDIVESAKTGLPGMFTKVKDAAASGVDWLKNSKVGQAAVGLFDNAKGLVSSGMSKLAEGASAIGSKVKGVFGKAAKEGAEAAADTGPIKQAIKKVIDKLITNKTVVKAFGSLKNKLGQVGAKLVAMLGGEVLEKALKSGAKATIGATIKQIAAFGTGGILAIGFAIADFVSGMGNARKYFNVYGEDVTLGMRLTAGIANTLGGLLTLIPGVGGILSVVVALFMDKIVQAVYGLLVGEDGRQELEKKQQNLSAATDAYNAENGTDLTVDEYAKKFNADGSKKTFLSGVKNAAVGAFKGIGKLNGKIIKGVDGLIEKVPLVGGVYKKGKEIVGKADGVIESIPLLGKAYKGVKGWLGFGGDEEDGSGRGLWGRGTPATAQEVSPLRTFIGDLKSTLGDFVSGIKNTEGDGIIGKAMTLIKDPKQLVELFASAGAGIGGSFINMMKDTFKTKNAGTGIFTMMGEGMGESMISDMKKTEGNNASISTAMTTAMTTAAVAGSGDTSLWEKAKNVIKGGWAKVKNFFGWGSGEGYDEWGTGQVTPMSQSAGRWNKNGNNNMAKAGCGPTAAAMVASAYGARGATPGEANSASYRMGMRAPDGGTNPAFFSQYASGHGYGMREGVADANSINSNLRNGQPVVVMGKGGAYGNNMHYMVADRTNGKGVVGLIDPLTGGRKTTSMSSLLGNTKTAVYSYGKGPSDLTSGDTEMSTQEAQQALVNALSGIAGQLEYSQDGGKQNPDNGSASCASTVAWAYRKVLGYNPGDTVDSYAYMRSSQQMKDSNFTTIYTKNGSSKPDLSMMQPGDIVYINWDNPNSYASPGHTEMYIGNGQNYSHGGGDSGKEKGPTLKNMNDYRLARTMAVRRFNPFMNGETVSASTIAALPMTMSATSTHYSGSPSTGTTGTTGTSTTGTTGTTEDISNMDMMGALSTVFSGMSSQLDNVMTALMGGTISEDGLPTDASGSNPAMGGTALPVGTTNFTFGTSAGTIPQSESALRIWNYLRANGFTPYGAAGIMGCWAHESNNRADRLEGDYLNAFPGFETAMASNANLNDWAVNGLFPAYARSDISINKDAYKGNDGNYYPGIGLAQWTGPRGYNLLQFAREKGLDWRDLDTQLQFFEKEIAGSYSNLKPNLNAATSPEDGARVGLDNFEMYSGWSSTEKGQEQLAVRAKSAAQIYNTYNGSENSSTSGGSTTDATTVAAMGPGWGRGADLGETERATMDYVKSINRFMTKSQDEGKADSTVAVLTERITDAISGNPSGGQPGEYNNTLTTIATSLATMVTLLQKISDNTEKTESDDTASSINARNNLPVASPSYPNGHKVPDDVGALTINRLTSI